MVTKKRGLSSRIFGISLMIRLRPQKHANSSDSRTRNLKEALSTPLRSKSHRLDPMMRRIRPHDPRSTSGTFTLPTEPRRGTSVRSRLVRVRRIYAIPDSPGPLIQSHLLHRPLHSRGGRRIVPRRSTTLRRRRVGRKAVRVGRDVRF